MTEQELNKKYKDLPPREEMTQEQERELVSDLFDMYEQQGFASVFWSQGSDYQQYHGQPFTVLGRVPEYGNPSVKPDMTADLEVLPMWNIQFTDGFELAVYPDEIIPSEMRDNGCPKKYLEDCIGKAAIINLGTETIHVCPNHCEALLSTVAHVAQTWKVDPFGTFVEEVSTDETTHEPDNGNIWECTECGTEAEMVECQTFKIENYGTLCLPVTYRGCAYWIPQGMTVARHTPIKLDAGRDAMVLTIEGHEFLVADFV